MAETWIICAFSAAAASATDFGAEALHGLEALAAGLEQDADEVDHHVAAAHGGGHRRPVAHIGLHRMNLADPPERLQMAGKIGPAHRDPDAVFAFRQRAHDMAAEKAGPAENRDQGVGIGLRSHRLPFRRAPAPDIVRAASALGVDPARHTGSSLPCTERRKFAVEVRRLGSPSWLRPGPAMAQ